MTRRAADYLVYSCEACGKRIFTERAFLGRQGECPCCGASHVVGGATTASEGEERRRAPRARPHQGQVAIHGRGPRREDVLFPLEDLSESGVSFTLPVQRDTRRLSGRRPPPVKVGDVVRIALMDLGELQPRAFQAEVARIEAVERKGVYLVGARFVGLDSAQREDLRGLVQRLLERERDRLR